MKHLMITTAFVALTAAPIQAGTNADTTPSADTEISFSMQDAQYDLSNLLGARVYIAQPNAETAPADADADLTEPHESWEDIGEIGEAYLTNEGEISSMVVDVGGFLGIGERHVEIDPGEITFKPDADDEGNFFVVYNGPRSDLEGKDEFNYETAEDNGMISARSKMADVPPAVALKDEAIADAGATAQTGTETASNEAANPEAEQVASDGVDAVNEDAADDKIAELTNDDRTALKAEDLQGLAVYDANQEHVGEISELILSEDGKITNVVVDVGGFLGIGEKPVALSFDEVKIMRLTEGGLKAETGSTMEDLEAMKSWGG